MLTADRPGIGGTIKQSPEDFEVEEIPAYLPVGSGDHLFLWIEKRDMGAEFFERQIAKRLDIPVGDVGTAGMKDRRAVARQWVSVPATAEAKLPHLDGEGLRVVQVSRHTNKLRPGHLHGNRFRILIRGADPAIDVAPIIDRLRSDGIPNYYGPQRFGRGGETVDLGLRLLRGQPLQRRPSPFLRKLGLSAAQSLLFNDYLARRQRDGLFRTVLMGDVMGKWPAGGMFVVDIREREQQRFDARETVITGPIFGRKTFAAAGAAAEREAAVLADHGLSPRAFDGFGKLALGTRRHLQIYCDDLTDTWEPEGLRLTFSLPAGSYATVLLREVMKTDSDAAADHED
jgi:tRNA pseudouridine13 synthase